jgi:hypothetical protein
MRLSKRAASVALVFVLVGSGTAFAQYLSITTAKKAARHLAAKIVREADGEGYRLLGCNRIDGTHVNCRVHDWGYKSGTIACNYSILVTPAVSRARHSHCFGSTE